MKKIIIMTLMMLCTFGYASAQNKADIKFDKTTHNFGTFSEKSPVQKCTFTFTNVGNAPLVINQAVASCGCTVAAYTKTPIAPGQKGEVVLLTTAQESHLAISRRILQLELTAL